MLVIISSPTLNFISICELAFELKIKIIIKITKILIFFIYFPIIFPKFGTPNSVNGIILIKNDKVSSGSKLPSL